MLTYENRCVDCDLYCLGSSCSNLNVPVYKCDKCETELGDDYYNLDGSMLCADCCLESCHEVF